MWGSQGWNQWALQPAMFNDVPHEKIDWAELAKQWIQMQQTQPSDSVSLAPPHLPQVVPPVSLPPPPPPPGHAPLMSEEFPENNIVPPPLLKTSVPPPMMPEPFHADSHYENEPIPFVPKTTDNSFWNKPQWEASVPNDVDERLWAPPPVESATPLLPGKETFDYGHVHDNPPLAMQSIDYNHMSDFSYNQMYPTPTPAPEVPYDQYWSQVNAAPTISPIFLKKERTSTSLPVEEETTQIDAAKRKQLPAWIRDGLEKMEQERLKRLEKERTAKENAEKKAKMDVLKNNLDFKDSSSIPAFAKSKFDSDSEVDENETNENKRISPVLKRTPSPTEETKTDEERKEELMLKVRRTLTEVLLTVTNSEMMDIAQEVFRKAISKAPARQLATATSLSSVASGLRGLATYGTESEASDQEEEEGSDSEEELYRKIKEKKRLFAQKEKRIIAELERKEHEEKIEAEREKINNDKKNERRPCKDFNTPEKLEDPSDDMGDKGDCSNTHMNLVEHNANIELSVLSVKTEEIEENSKSNPIKIENLKPVAENLQFVKKEESDSSDSEESSSSVNSSQSGEKHRKKLHSEAKKSKSELKKTRKDKNSTKHSSRYRRSRSRDSDSSGKHRRERSHERKNSNSKKKKKYKRSDSSGSSSSSSRKRKRSSRYESSYREHRSHSYDREGRRRRSDSSCQVRHKNDSRSSRSYRHSDDRKYKDEKKRHSPSSRLPRKYRSRSLSSESSVKKMKKYRNR